MLELLILLSSDISLYCNTFDMMHRYTWSLYRPISTIHIRIVLRGVHNIAPIHIGIVLCGVRKL